MDNSVLEIYGKRLIEWRNSTGKSREKFSEELGMHPQSLGRYERGERLPPAEEMEKICTRSKLPIHWFFTDPETEKEPRTVTPSEALQVLTQFIRSSDERADCLQRELAEARREIARLKASQSLPTSYVAEVDTSHYTRRRSQAKPKQNREHKESS